VSGEGVETTRDFVVARSAAARVVAEKSLRFLNNLYVESQELKELLRGETQGGMGGGEEGMGMVVVVVMMMMMTRMRMMMPPQARRRVRPSGPSRPKLRS
jgi:hypothetical protein